jgi:hypothetical protein
VTEGDQRTSKDAGSAEIEEKKEATILEGGRAFLLGFVFRLVGDILGFFDRYDA